jgi:hypothetical protein
MGSAGREEKPLVAEAWGTKPESEGLRAEFRGFSASRYSSREACGKAHQESRTEGSLGTVKAYDHLPELIGGESFDDAH